MHISRRDFPKEFIKKKHPFLHLLVSCLQTGSATIPKINAVLNSVSRIFILKIQKDWSTRTETIVSTDEQQCHTVIQPQNFCGRIIITDSGVKQYKYGPILQNI